MRVADAPRVVQRGRMGKVGTNRARAAAKVILALAAGLVALMAVAATMPRDRVEAAPPPPLPPITQPAPAPEPEPLLEVKRVLDVPAVAFGEWTWDESGAPRQGRIVMTVDLHAQTISVFRDGYEIGTAAVLYGADDKPTPLGRFPVLEKDADHVSNLYGAPMPYMLRLTTDGVAIHGSAIEEGYATHGCIGVPTPFARKLFAAVRKGDLAVITRGRLLKLGDRIT